ncbi:MAG TPA: hypothetical protein VL551_16900 [Actinospica sp.]|jgi:hypothetical protein|nr:hypothetical protein [Actinospica sp.]
MSEVKQESLSRIFWSAYKDHHPDGTIMEFDRMPEEDQAAIEAGAYAVAAHVADPTAEDYDHASEILKLRDTLTELLGEFKHTAGNNWSALVSGEHFSRLRARLEQL